jgi:hypothetical protein
MPEELGITQALWCLGVFAVNNLGSVAGMRPGGGKSLGIIA